MENSKQLQQALAQHTNAAIATAPHQLHNHSPNVVDRLQQLVDQSVAKMLPQVLEALIAGAIDRALGGVTAPHFPLPTSSPSGRVTNAMQQCSHTGCMKAVRSKGLCSAHYQKARRDEEKAAAAKPAAKTTRRRKK